MMIKTLLICLMMISGHASAALYQCKNEIGEVEFMDVPCPEASKETTLAKDLDERGFYKKYFLPPKYNKLKPNCTKHVCYCGSRKINLKYNAERQLIESAKEIPRVLNRFNNSYSRYKRKKQSNYSGDLKAVQALACELALHQTFFDKHFVQYQMRLKETQAKKNRIKGQAIECGDTPQIKANEKVREFRYRHDNYNACLKNKNRNYGYKNSQSRYKSSEKILHKMETAFSKLRQKP